MDPVPKVHVKEANDHLQRMFARVMELEDLTKQQAAKIASRDEELERLRADRKKLDEKDRQIADLREKLASSEAMVERLVAEVKERDAGTAALKEKAKQFDCILDSRDTLERVVESLRLYDRGRIEGSSEDSGVSVGTGQDEQKDDEN